MKQIASILALLVLGSMISGLAHEAHAMGKFGGGIHYLRSLEDLKDADDIDKNSIGILGAYLVDAGILRADLILEWIPNYLGLDEALIMPQGYLLFGQLIYGGVGIGTGYYDGEWLDDPFYALRAGAALDLGGLGVDVFATYHFMKWKTVENLDSDDWNSITFGVLVRFGG